MMFFFFGLSCHKWSILDVQFRVKTIESCSSGASTTGVDIFRGGGGGSVFVFPRFPQLWGSVRAEEAFLAASFPIKRGRKPFQFTHLDWISVLLWWSVMKQEQTISSLGSLWRNWRQNPTHTHTHVLLHLLFKLSVYVKDWAANSSIDRLQASFIRQAGLSSVSTATLDRWHIHWKKGGGGAFNSKHIRSQTSWPWERVSLWRQLLHTWWAVFWHVTVSHAVTLSVTNFFLFFPPPLV